MNISSFIAAKKVQQGCVQRTCDLLRVSRAASSAFSARALCERKRTDDELLNHIRAAHTASRGTYGSARITRALRKRGLTVSRKRVARLMARRGIVGRVRRRKRNDDR